MPKVFISYVRENSKKVEKLVKTLKSNGVDVWFDKTHLNPGDRWMDVIRKAIADGDFFIACFSEEYTRRPITVMNEEITQAIEKLRQIPTERPWFIPVLLSECNVPDRSIGAGATLNSIQRVALYENWDEGVRSILKVIQPTIEDSIQPTKEELRAAKDEWDQIREYRGYFWEFNRIAYSKFQAENIKLALPADIVELTQSSKMPPNVPVLDSYHEKDWYFNNKEGLSLPQKHLWNYCKFIYPEDKRMDRWQNWHRTLCKDIANFHTDTRKKYSSYFNKWAKVIGNKEMKNIAGHAIYDVALISWVELALVHSLQDPGVALCNLFSFGNYLQDVESV